MLGSVGSLGGALSLTEEKSWLLERSLVPAGTVVLLVAKLYYVHSQFRAPLLARPFWLVVTLLTLCVLLLSALNFKTRRGNGFALLVNGLLSVLLWGDLLYYRLFSDWPSLSSLVAAHQLGAAGQSMWGAARLSDLWLFFDLPFWCLTLLSKTARDRPAGLAYRLLPLALTLSPRWGFLIPGILSGQTGACPDPPRQCGAGPISRCAALSLLRSCLLYIVLLPAPCGALSRRELGGLSNR